MGPRRPRWVSGAAGPTRAPASDRRIGMPCRESIHYSLFGGLWKEEPLALAEGGSGGSLSRKGKGYYMGSFCQVTRNVSEILTHVFLFSDIFFHCGHC